MSPLEILEQACLVDCQTLITGLDNDWCSKEDIVKFAEGCLLQNPGELDVDLVSIVAGESLPLDQFLLVCMGYIDAHYRPIDQHANESALTKWRFAHLSSLLKGKASDEEKIEALQVVYSQFGFPEAMASCSIYSHDGIDPLVAAEIVQRNLAEQLRVTGA